MRPDHDVRVRGIRPLRHPAAFFVVLQQRRNHPWHALRSHQRNHAVLRTKRVPYRVSRCSSRRCAPCRRTPSSTSHTPRTPADTAARDTAPCRSSSSHRPSRRPHSRDSASHSSPRAASSAPHRKSHAGISRRRFSRACSTLKNEVPHAPRSPRHTRSEPAQTPHTPPSRPHHPYRRSPPSPIADETAPRRVPFEVRQRKRPQVPIHAIRVVPRNLEVLRVHLRLARNPPAARPPPAPAPTRPAESETACTRTAPVAVISTFTRVPSFAVISTL